MLNTRRLNEDRRRAVSRLETALWRAGANGESAGSVPIAAPRWRQGRWFQCLGLHKAPGGGWPRDSSPMIWAWTVSSATGSAEHRMRSATRGWPDLGPLPSSPMVASIRDRCGRTTLFRFGQGIVQHEVVLVAHLAQAAPLVLQRAGEAGLGVCLHHRNGDEKGVAKHPGYVDAPKYHVVRPVDRHGPLIRKIQPRGASVCKPRPCRMNGRLARRFPAPDRLRRHRSCRHAHEWFR